MSDLPRILVAGATGVFGRRLLEDLAVNTISPITIAARSEAKLRHMAAWLEHIGSHIVSNRFEICPMDLRDPSALATAAEGHGAVVCTAGPFSELSPQLPAAAIAAGAHWLDISDDRAWVMGILQDTALHERALAAGLGVAPGLSSTPAISGVLARRCKEFLPEATEALVTLYIGNKNRKGVGSIARAIAAGTTESTLVELPMGTRKAWRFESPDAPLLKEELGLEAQFAVSFQATLGYRLMATFANPGLARLIAFLTKPLGMFGDPRGCLQVEAWAPDQRRAAAWVIGHDQRMPVIPLQMALDGLLNASWPKTRAGVLRPWGDVSTEEWEAGLRARGLNWGQKRPTPT